VLDAKGFFEQTTWGGWFRSVWKQLNGNGAGVFSGTVVLAKITGGGANGSLTLVNGVVTSYTAPT